MRADLHCHSHYSDGFYSPEEVLLRAKSSGVTLCSITDHDSMEGAEEKRACAKALGICYLDGWEVSAYLKGKVHVLGYGCQRKEAYRAFVEARKEGAVLRAQEMIERANRVLNLSLTIDHAQAFHQKENAPLHTMHVVRAFAKELGVYYGDLYEQLFAEGKEAHSTLCRPTPQEAVDVIHACGGKAFLAHPARILLDEHEKKVLLDHLVDGGLDGIECYHSAHTAVDTEYFLRYASSRRLLVSGGSDFHKDGTGRKVGFPAFYANGELLMALSVSR